MSAGYAAVYVPANDECAFGQTLSMPCSNDAERRHRMGKLGRDRVEKELSWEMSRRALVQFYDRCFARKQSRNKAASKLAWYAGRASGDVAPRDRLALQRFRRRRGWP